MVENKTITTIVIKSMLTGSIFGDTAISINKITKEKTANNEYFPADKAKRKNSFSATNINKNKTFKTPKTAAMNTIKSIYESGFSNHLLI